jgi:hypothetical protein
MVVLLSEIFPAKLELFPEIDVYVLLLALLEHVCVCVCVRCPWP